MPITDLSTVQTKMFGVSLLGEQNQTMLLHWKERFSPTNTFFVNAHEGESEDLIAEQILNVVKDAKVRILDDSLILALFFDLRKPLQAKNLQALLKLPDLLEELLHCQQVHIHCFGYTGLVAFSQKEAIKANIRLFQEVDQRTHKLWLVADDAQGSEKERWKPAILFLDFLRRHENPYSLMSRQHSEGSVGFLRYGEYQQQRRIRFKAEIEQLKGWISECRQGSFSEKLSVRLEALRQSAREAFLVDAKAQPLHPDMFPKGFFDQQKAKKNKDPFRTARQFSQSAVIATGVGLTRQIHAYVMGRVGALKPYLIRLLEEAKVSISFVEDRVELRRRITMPIEETCEPLPLYLPYNKDGYENPIEKYLTEVRETAITMAINALLKGLAEACDSLSAEAVRGKKMEFSHRLEECGSMLASLPDLENFCRRSFVEGKGLMSPITVSLAHDGNDTLRILMCRNMDDRNWIADHVSTETIVNSNCQCYIDENMGGIIKLDDAPVKCVFAAYFNCTEACLNDLLKIG